MNDSIEEKYQHELELTEKSHHQPTAGAMSSHIMANLWYLDVKYHQIKWYLEGTDMPALSARYQKMISHNREQIDQLGELLLSEREIVPSTIAEITEYAQINEDGRLKYMTATEMVTATVNDLNIANLFMTRAIKLAQREDRPMLGLVLTQMLGYNNDAIRYLEAFLRQAAWQDMKTDDE
ncbi:DNA starvation/stationary phase protection protein [Weissella diestrammenae]|uniref:DNA starvation/stationary phase protection protein n=1 Tax=Weissella diestrammenae TaxID=1162633 RepID=A0A7G9T5K1_9LACO|nr:ferritin-like domain-containing protein [Weissella diestrammenae]MCM0582203.1 DNA starvation/stationary phase protection protein [Weissella diestrammenae]QNN75376.1 DNA starvation/stationary phase protection protein [Weissella diestrammenae]